MYVSRKEGRRGLAIIEDIVDTSIRELNDDVQNNKERLLYSDEKQSKDNDQQNGNN